VLLHGWMDVSASFQFVVDAFERDWHVVAPDWRGFGLSEAGPGDCYCSPTTSATSIRSSTRSRPTAGDAGRPQHGRQRRPALRRVRPARVRAAVNLEGFGLKDCEPRSAGTLCALAR